MNKIEKIKGRFYRVIQKEKLKAEQEISDFEFKKHDNEVVYGFGLWYSRYENAKNRREKYIDELSSLKNNIEQAVPHEKLVLYAYYCPTCRYHIYLEHAYKEPVDCPVCHRSIYKDGRYTEWDVVTNSKFVQTH